MEHYQRPQKPLTLSHHTSPTSPSLQTSLNTRPHPLRLVCTEQGTIPLQDNPQADLGPDSLLTASIEFN